MFVREKECVSVCVWGGGGELGVVVVSECVCVEGGRV